MPEKPIPQVIEEHRSSLLTLSGILEIGQGGHPYATHIITIYVPSKTSDILALSSSTLEGYAIVKKETGDIETV